MEIINATQQLSEVSKKIQNFVSEKIAIIATYFIFSLPKYYGMPDYTKHF